MLPPELAKLDELTSTNAADVKGRVLIVDEKGFALSDSAAPGRAGANYSTRPEIQAAIHGKRVQVFRYSDTLKREILATAVPIIHFGNPVGAVRITQGASEIQASQQRTIMMLILVTVIVLAIGGGFAWLIAGQMTRPIRALGETASRVRGDDLDVRAEVAGPKEVRNSAIAFNEMLDRIAEFVETRQDFLRKASHQMKTPIGGMRQRLDEIEYLSQGNDEVLHEVGGADELVTRMKAITDGILHLAKLKTDDMPHPETIDLNRYAEEVAARWAIHHQEGDAEPQSPRVVAVPSGGEVSPCVSCARESLDAVMEALVENGVAYGGEAGPVEIRVSLRGLEVLDRGPGIDEDEKESIFEVFGRGSAGAARPEGTGLGLAIARETAIQMGGNVELENRTDGARGARAVVTLPGAGSDAGETAAAAADDPKVD